MPGTNALASDYRASCSTRAGGEDLGRVCFCEAIRGPAQHSPEMQRTLRSAQRAQEGGACGEKQRKRDRWADTRPDGRSQVRKDKERRSKQACTEACTSPADRACTRCIRPKHSDSRLR
eukprot:3504210-Rhodomonas_salina.4